MTTPPQPIRSLLRTAGSALGRSLLRIALSGLLVLPGFPIRAADEPPMKVYILAGQSNGEGKGDGDKIPAAYAGIDPGLRLFHRFKGDKDWKPLAPYSARPDQAKMYGCGATMFGPEISFGHEMKKQFPNHRIGIIKVCVGGTSVVAWSKDVDSPEAARLMELLGAPRDKNKPPLYQQLTGDIRDALGRIQGDYEIAGFLWIQGEKDSLKPEAAAAWAARVLKLHQDVAADIGYPADVPLVVMEPHIHVFERGNTAHAKVLMEAMNQLAAEGGEVTLTRLKEAAGLGSLTDAELNKHLSALRCFGPAGLLQIQGAGIMDRNLKALAQKTPHLRTVFSADLPTHEGLHFNSEGQIELGQRLSQALALQPAASQFSRNKGTELFGK